MVQQMIFEEFEDAAIRVISELDKENPNALYEQYKNSKITRREFTGIGFFIDFEPGENVEPLNPKIYNYGGGTRFDFNGIKHTGGFVVFFKNGFLDCLEVFTYDGWPEVVTNYEIYSGSTLIIVDGKRII